LVTVTIFLVLAALPSFAQDLPDPGRRLSPEEQNADPEKPRPAKPPTRARTRRDEKACENARIYYQLACRAPGSRSSYGRECNEAYALYRQNCP
jgi:hypothetical protein